MAFQDGQFSIEMGFSVCVRESVCVIFGANLICQKSFAAFMRTCDNYSMGFESMIIAISFQWSEDKIRRECQNLFFDDFLRI